MNRTMYDNFRNRLGGNSSSLFGHNEKEEGSVVDELENYKASIKETYYRSILNPEAHISKVPSKIPAESALAPLKWQFNITPNINGKFCLIIDPFYSIGYLYQSSTVDGVGGAGTLTSLSFAQDANIIDQWRLVSSSLILKYYGSFNNMSGLFVAATTSNLTAATQTTYLTFNNIEDLSNRQVLRCIDGCKLIYAPMDEKATDFNSQTMYSAGTHPCRWQYLFVVCGDAFPSTSCIRVDYFRNIEYTSTPAYKEYIPQQRSTPVDVPLPVLRQPVGSAPVDFRGGNINDQMNAVFNQGPRRKDDLYSKITDKVADAMIDMGKQALGPLLDVSGLNSKDAFNFTRFNKF